MTALVLTGSIRPQAPNTSIEDPAYRAAEYARAIRFYLDQLSYPIHFIENSDHDIEEDPELGPLLNSERLHLHRDREEGRPDLGKGYEDLRILDPMVEKLEANGYDFLIKVSGRYIVQNVLSLIPEKKELAYFDRHPRIKNGIAITSFFACPIPFYLKHIKGAYAEVNEQERRTIEKVVFKRLDGLEGKEAPRLFPWEPIFEGRSGTSGQPIGRHPNRRRLRNLYRKLLRAGGYHLISHEL
ncbi:MAG: hypothetical protein ABEH38_06670 [Flavobacteriales bacterium]